MCGIFGMVSNDPKKINSGNIKILGLNNESRGKDSCGLFLDGEIYYGIEGQKLFSNFCKGVEFNASKYPFVIGHTRQSSVGVVNMHNAHPFGYGANGEDYEQVFVHNGTLLNYKELAEEYGIELELDFVENNIHKSRTKIDSEILGEILYKTKSLKVLSEYDGRAALVWANTKKPNVIYLFSGKSKPNKSDQEKDAVEERPMNVWIKDENTFYFSSLKEGLEIIGGKSDEVFQIDYNTVYVVTDGDFRNAEKIKISRRDRYHTEYKFRNYTTGYYPGASAWTANHNVHTTLLPTVVKEDKFVHIKDDTSLHPLNYYKGKVYNKSFRYYRNGHLINGIYIFLPNYGFYFVSEDTTHFHDSVKRLQDKYFCLKTGNVVTKKDKNTIAFNDSNYEYHYFIEGVKLQHYLDFSIFIANMKEQNKNLFDLFETKRLSYASEHPIFNIKEENTLNEQKIYKNGQLFTGSYKGLGYEREYFCKNGNLLKKTYLEDEQLKINFDEILDKTSKFLEKSNEEYTKLIEQVKDLSKKNEDELLDICYGQFAFLLDSVIEFKDEIEPYKEIPLYKEVSNSLNNMILEINNYLPDLKTL